MARLLVWVMALCVFVLMFSQSAEGQKKMRKKPVKRRMQTIVRDLESNVTALWSEVKQLSQPVHVHLHGDSHVMDPKFRPHPYHDDDDEDSHPHPHPPQHDEKDRSDEDDNDKDDGDDKQSDEERMRKGKPNREHRRHHHDKDEDEDDAEDGKKMMWMMKKKKMMMMKKKKHGPHHHGENDHDEDEDDEEEGWREWKGKYGKHRGTHVHIHLHTGMEEEEEESRHHHHMKPSMPKEFRYARCDVVPNSALPFMEREDIKGTFYFRQMPNQPLEIKAMLMGFEVKHPGGEDKEEGHKHLRGVHGHQYGDMSTGCNSLGGHMNPSGVSHGGPEAEHRHLGDFGNLEVNHDGSVVTSFTDDVASLFGPDSMLGKSMVIHAGADDLGSGHSEASRKTGNAGKRSACCVIVASPQPADDSGIWPKDGQLAPIKPPSP